MSSSASPQPSSEQPKGAPNPPAPGVGRGESSEAGPEAVDSATAPAQRSARVIFCTAVLTLEAFVVLFATLVGFGLQVVEPRALIWAFGGAGVLICLVAAGVASRRAGLVLGSVVQVALIGAGLAIPMMFVIGIVFAIIWVVALLLGARIDRERAERAEAAAGADPAT